MNRAPRLLLISLLAAVCVAPVTGQSDSAGPVVTIELEPREATVGDPLDVTLTVDLPDGTGLLSEPLGPEIGPFTVLDGGWEAPVAGEGGSRHVWRGRIAAYETGDLSLPAMLVRVEAEGGEVRTARTEPVGVQIRSVLTAEDRAADSPAIGDLKPAASIEPDYGPLRTAAVILVALMLLSALAWWLVRRYGDRLAAKPAPVDPFHRLPPEVWAYGELQRLLSEGLSDPGDVDGFYTRLAWVLKRYLSGRYRLELMERTTLEVPPPLKQAGAPGGASAALVALLERCDRVKFAGDTPGPDVCRADVEEAYRLVDATRPAPGVDAERQKGAA